MGTPDDEAINIPGTPLINGPRGGLPDPACKRASKKTRWVCLLTTALVALLILAIILLATLGGQDDNDDEIEMMNANERLLAVSLVIQGMEMCAAMCFVEIKLVLFLFFLGTTGPSLRQGG